MKLIRVLVHARLQELVDVDTVETMLKMAAVEDIDQYLDLAVSRKEMELTL